MRKRAKQFVAAAMAGVMALGMAACGSGDDTKTTAAGTEKGTEATKDAGTTEGNSGEEVKLVTIIEEPNVEYYPVFFEKLKELYPNYKITSKTWDQGQVEKTVKTAFAGGESIDIVKWFPNQMESFLNSDMALDLTPYLDDEWKSIWVDNALDIGTYDGKTYCLPITTVYPDIDVNVDLMEKAGVDVKDEWTWEEFVAACEKIKTNLPDVFPFGIKDTRCGWFLRNAFLQIWDTKAEMEDFIAGNISFKDERVVAAMDEITDLFVKGYAYPGEGAFSQTNDQIKAAFTQGKIAMMFDVNNGGQQMHEQMAEAGYKNVRTIGWPTMAKGECEYVLGGCDGYFIPANCKNVDAAVNVLKYLTSEEAFKLQVERGDVVPANVSAGDNKDAEQFARDSSKVYPKEIMQLSSELGTYVDLSLAANYYYDKESTLNELEDLREAALAAK